MSSRSYSGICEEEKDDLIRESLIPSDTESGILKARHHLVYPVRYERRTHAGLVSPDDVITLQEAFRLTAAAHTPKESVNRVIENIKSAPIAYFKFLSIAALVCFLFSIAFFKLFDTILVNPVFAVYGAVGSFLSWVLAVGTKALKNER